MRHGFYWPSAVKNAKKFVRTCEKYMSDVRKEEERPGKSDQIYYLNMAVAEMESQYSRTTPASTRQSIVTSPPE
jgi:hypothetical protein